MSVRDVAKTGALLALLALGSVACEPTGPAKGGPQEGVASVDVNPGMISFEANSDEGMQSRTVSLQNHGTGVLLLSDIRVGVELGEFTIVEGVDPATGTLEVPPRTQKWITVAWDPTSGDASGALFMSTNDPQKPAAQVELSALVQSPTDIDDPDTPVDGEKLDVYLLLDVAYNYSCYHPELDRFIDEIIDALYEKFDNVAVGFGVYDDYREGDWATVGMPYEMRHAVSTDYDSVKEAASRLRMEYGGSDEGTAYEAIYQAVWGAGFDHDCNGTFDSAKDIRPWAPMESDAFGGAAEGLNVDFPADGERRGVGWREGATHLVIYSVDNIIRDTAVGSELPAGSCGEPARREAADHSAGQGIEQSSLALLFLVK